MTNIIIYNITKIKAKFFFNYIINNWINKS